MEPLNDEQLAALRAWPSPAISNAIETFGVRARNYGAMTPDIRCHFPEMEPIVGYAVTCKIRASVPADQDPEANVERGAWYDHIESIPGPRIVVIEDMDDPPVGSFWGEVNGKRASSVWLPRRCHQRRCARHGRGARDRLPVPREGSARFPRLRAPDRGGRPRHRRRHHREPR